MIKTIILGSENDSYKEYHHHVIQGITGHVVPNKTRKKMIKDVLSKTSSHGYFSFELGDVDIKKNDMFCLDYVSHKTDLVLPKNPIHGDWVVLYYNQTMMALTVSNERPTPIKIRGNGKRIMGYDEPLLCDIAFSSIRLTFIDDQNGWVLT